MAAKDLATRSGARLPARAPGLHPDRGDPLNRSIISVI
jgi:hypothetical protein